MSFYLSGNIRNLRVVTPYSSGILRDSRLVTSCLPGTLLDFSTVTEYPVREFTVLEGALVPYSPVTLRDSELCSHIPREYGTTEVCHPYTSGILQHFGRLLVRSLRAGVSDSFEIQRFLRGLEPSSSRSQSSLLTLSNTRW